MSVVSLSMSVLSLPRPYLPEFGSLACLLNCLVSELLLLQDTEMTLRKYKNRYLSA